MSIFRLKGISIFFVTIVILFSTTFQTVLAVEPDPDTLLDTNNLQKLSVQSKNKTNDSVSFDLGDYNGNIHLLSKDMVKISILPKDKTEQDSPAIQKKNWETPSFTTKQMNNQYLIKTSELNIIVKEKPFGIKILDKKGHVINEDYMKNGTSSGYENSKPYVFKKTDSNENFYGFGEQSGLTLNKRGKNMGMWNTDAYAYGPEAKYLYASIPFFIGLKNGKAYGLLFDNTYRSYYNMASDSDNYYYFYANGGPLTYYFMYGPEISHVLEQYTDLTGKMDLPPEWSLGLNQSKFGYSPTEIIDIAKTYREKQIPLDTMHFDIDYMNGYRIFTWNEQYKQALQQLKALGGFHAVLINDPGVKQDENYLIYQEGTAKGYWVKNADGSDFIGPVWPGDSAFPNFLKSDVRNWWATSLGPILNDGADGIWNDMNEPSLLGAAETYFTLPLDAYGKDDNDNTVLSKEFHNIYGHLENEATYNAWRINNSNESL
ncbi:glycoside hydrolase family 31 protein [Niallia sp. 01092]|uniref:glycoside hydrolase family 31 protein n=1 Tax=unclassified Niallia TaxID=2837522 RepID=UPI003FD5B3DD